MEQKIDLLNEIFETELTPEDLDKKMEEVLEWDSFHIMNFLVMVQERFHRRISIEQIAELRCIRDLLEQMKEE